MSRAEASLPTRTRILAAARQLLERQGTSFRLEDVAKAAGLSRQAVYLHFGSRRGLLLALVEYVDQTEGLDRFRQGMRVATSGVEELNALIDLMAAYTPRIYRTAKVMDEARRTDREMAAAWENRMQERRDGCRRIIERIQREGDLAPGWTVPEAAEMLWALVAVSTWEDLVIDRGWSAESYARFLKRICSGGFVAQQ